MGDDGGTGRRYPPWYWISLDTGDDSPHSRFRRQVAAVAREVMLAHGADPDSLPPLPASGSPTTEVAATGAPSAPEPSAQSAPGSSGPAAPGSSAPEPLAPGPAAAYFDLRATVLFAIETASGAVHRVVRRQGTSPTLTADVVLLAIARSRGGTTRARLGRAVELAPSTLSTAVGRLVEEGWVSRGPVPGDRRRRLLRVTAEGRREAERIAATWRQAEDGLLGGLSPEERDELGRLLRRAAATLQRRPGGR